MRVAVTGATGFLGSRIVAELARRGHRPVSLVRRAGRAHLELDERIVGDLLTADLDAAFDECDAVINCAARVHVVEREAPASAEAAYRSMNAELPLAMAAAARRCGVHRFVQISSVAAIGSTTPAGVSVDDSAAPCPDSPYGRSKLEADIALAAISSAEMPILSLRPPAIYGASVGAFFASLMRTARLGLPLPIAAVDNRRSFAYAGNIADAVVNALDGSVSGAYILTDSAPIATADLYRKLLALYGHGDRVWRWPEPLIATTAKLALRSRAQSFIGNAAYDGARFAADFGWAAPLAMDDALARTIAGIK